MNFDKKISYTVFITFYAIIIMMEKMLNLFSENSYYITI